MFDKDIILEDERVLLRPLNDGDTAALAAISGDAAIWSFFIRDLAKSQDLAQWVRESQEQRAQSIRYPFVIFDKQENAFAGSTSYGNVSPRDKRLEIGWTWLGRKFQGTGLNRHCKRLLMQYAFEELGYERVEFKTDVLNRQSRGALKKIGATEEGILRSHTLMPHNRRRDTIYYSVLRNEWAGVKEMLLKPL